MDTRGKVLVVDDEEVVCKSVKKILSRKELEVDTVLSASEALDKMSKEDYWVVITDLMMPKITGMQLLKEIKTNKPDTAVIMITGYATIRTAVQAIKLGAFDYIPKPFTPQELTSVTLRAMERTRIYREEKVREEAVPKKPVVEKKAPVAEPEKEEVAAIEFIEEEKDEEALALEGSLYCMPEHSWARIEKNGSVTVGMEDMFQRTAGEIVNIDLPYEGDEVRQGDVCVRITSSGLHIHKLWSPVTGKVIGVNEALNKDCSLA
jgi:YesN/AraC family two-component response regulator